MIQFEPHKEVPQKTGVLFSWIVRAGGAGAKGAGAPEHAGAGARMPRRWWGGNGEGEGEAEAEVPPARTEDSTLEHLFISVSSLSLLQNRLFALVAFQPSVLFIQNRS